MAQLCEHFSTLPGATRIFNKLPQSWKALPGSKLLAQTENGFKWVKQESHVLRVMKPNDNTPYNYARFFKNKSYYDINKNPVLDKDPLGHINLDDVTDEYLDWFFN